MKEIRVKLIARIKRTESVESFRFQASEKIDFVPGQFLQLIFDEANRANPLLNKYLSFSCSPASDYIEVTKRISESLFSQRLKGLSLGNEILVKAPLGKCVFSPEDKKVAFLIGGIGITPVISITQYVAGEGLDTSMVLFYSNRTMEEIAFKKELDSWKESRCNLKVFYCLTDCPDKEGLCYFGRIDKGFIVANAPDIGERTVFIFGPPKMVEVMNDLCLEIGCPKEKVKTENFVGY